MLVLTAKRQSSYVNAMESPVPRRPLYRCSPIEEDDELPPDIIIPPPLFSPLPLQCLAADALPDAVKREIEIIVAEYASGGAVAQTWREVEAELKGAEPGLDDEKRLILRRNANISQLANDLGFGVRILGGVMCGCGQLHAVITDNQSTNPALRDGVCVVQWQEEVLEGSSFEKVKRILMASQGTEEVEVVIKECRKLELSSGEGTARKYSLQAHFSAVPKPEQLISECVSTEKVPEIQDGKGPVLQKPTKQLSSPNVKGSETQLGEGISPQEAEKSPHLLTMLPQYSLKTTILPKSPTIGGTDDNLADFFACLPNGMIELSMTYRWEDATLGIVLDQVKDHTSSGGQTSDVFINTYLVPDTRKQGVRSIMVNDPSSNGLQPLSYDIKEHELESVALRVILWEIQHKQKISFRGEVLLALDDEEVVNLEGEPTWYTVCALDPNLPPLPAPVHYKNLQTLWQGTEHLFTRLKQKVSSGQAHALSYFKHHTRKQKSLPRGTTGSKAPIPPTWRQLSLPSRGGLERLALSPVLTAIQHEQICEESEEEEDDLSSSSSQSQLTTRSRLAAILRVLRDDQVPADSPDHGWMDPLSSEDEEGFSTLDHQGRGRTAAGNTQDDDDDNRNESFRFIPVLQDSLKAGRRKSVTVYSFLNEASLKQVQSLVKEPLLTVVEHNEPGRSPPSSQVHLCCKTLDYSVGSGEEHASDVPQIKTTSTPELHQGHRPTSSVANTDEVSIRITPATLDRQQSEASASSSYYALSPLSSPHVKGHTHSRMRPRSKSVGDILGWGTAPSEKGECVPSSIGLGPSDQENFLDSAGRDRKPGVQGTSAELRSQWPYHSRQRVRKKFSLPPFGTSTEDSQRSKPRMISMSTWKSFDDLLDVLPVPKALSKKSTKRKNSTTSVNYHHQKPPSLPDISRQACSVKLEFSYSPAEPVFTVDLVDVICSPAKSNFDFVLKVIVYHSRTGVSLLKRKTSFSLDRTSSCPLARVQFNTDITNLSLQVCLVRIGKLLSRKSAGQVSIDLNSLDLGHTTDCLSQWFNLTKPQTT